MFSFISSLGGFVFFAALVALVYKRDAVHWEYLYRYYGKSWHTPLRERWGSVVLYGKYPLSKAYNGIVKIGIHPDGLSLCIRFPIISYFCKPLFIPYRDICGWDQTWYIDGKTIELELKGAPDVKIAMPREQVEWIRKAGGTGIKMMHQFSPHNDKPVLWHGFVLVSSFLLFFGTIFILIDRL